MWKPLFENYKIHINFAYRTFRWDSEASLKAHVHCVIIGFSTSEQTQKYIFDENKIILSNNINPYLLNAPNILVSSRSKPIDNVPKMLLGNKPADGGNLIISEQEKEDIIKKEPNISKFIHPYIGADEFINNKLRYCFWLLDITPYEIKSSKELSSRISKVKEKRLNSTAKPTREKSAVPHLFFSFHSLLQIIL